MNDQLFILSSDYGIAIALYDLFGVSIKERTVNAPAKKSIKETVPFSNKTYDFSAINGEIYWEEREIEYVMECVAESHEELEAIKMTLNTILMNTMNEWFSDTLEPEGLHFVGTFDSIKYDDDEGGEKTTLTVVFTAYPYRIEDQATEGTRTISASSQTTMSIYNESSHRVVPTITTTAPVTIQTEDGISYSIPAGTVKDDTLMLKMGSNNWTVYNNNNSACTVTVAYYVEVF